MLFVVVDVRAVVAVVCGCWLLLLVGVGVCCCLMCYRFACLVLSFATEPND